MRIVLMIGLILISISSPISAQSEHLYSTWETLELDTCSSAWLIKRFIDKEAVFKFYPKGDLIEEGKPFDTPDAKYQRTQKYATFENLMIAYKLEDAALARLGRLIHEIEINYWAGEPPIEAAALNEAILTISKMPISPQQKFERSFQIFDDWYEK